MKIFKKHTYLADVAVWVLLAAQPGCALAASAAPEAPEAPAVAPPSGDAGEVTDIVVTANRREQKLQDVPVTISAITSEKAAAMGITGTTTLQMAVPSLDIARQGNLSVPYLRGLGSSSGSPNSENSVALYVDGVYMPSSNANFFEFNNVDRIEVLKGPQGTLFGRNASGGVIQIITKDPTHTLSAKVEVGYANYNTASVKAYVSGGITDNLSANLSVLYSNQHDGWGHNLDTGKQTRGDEEIGLRGKLLWSIGGHTEVRLSGFYTRSDSAGLDAQIVPGATNILGQGYFGNYNVRGVSDRGVTKSGGGSITVNHDFGPVQLKSISAYNKTDGFWTFDGDQSVLNVLYVGPLNQFARMFSQEVHLLSRPDAKFQWLVGGFYFHYKAGLDPQEIRGQLFDPGVGVSCTLGVSCNSNAGFDLNDFTKSTSSAIFAQGTYPIFADTNLTAGVRYTWDKEVFEGSTFVPGTTIPIPGIGGPATATAKDAAPTFRVSLDHKFTRDIMAYVSFNRGLKAGGFGLGSSVQQQNTSTPFAPEKVNAVEGGFKTELFDRKVRFNLAGFYYDFKNIQLQRVTGGNAITFNGPQATIYGGEVELEAHPTANLVLNGTLGLVHSKIGNFPGAPNTCRVFATGHDDLGGFFCDPVTGASTTTPYNAKGNQLPFATPVTANLSFIYTIPSSVGKFDLSAGGYHYGGAYTEIDNRLKINPYTLINASILWTHKSGALTVRVWGKNLTNKYHYSEMSSEAGFFDIGSPAAPRQYGVTLGYKF